MLYTWLSSEKTYQSFKKMYCSERYFEFRDNRSISYFKAREGSFDTFKYPGKESFSHKIFTKHAFFEKTGLIFPNGRKQVFLQKTGARLA